MKKVVLFCLGPSGSGKSYFIKNNLPADKFYNLKSATTRPMRPGEVDGREYYFRDEDYFDQEDFATHLWVNERVWNPGQPRWMYGVPTFEILNNMGTNLVYDVIEPRYARQMIDWFHWQKLASWYDFKTLYFIAPDYNMDIAMERANMPNEDKVRKYNTCNPIDFLRAGLDIDFLIKNTPTEKIISPRLQNFLSHIMQRKK